MAIENTLYYMNHICNVDVMNSSKGYSIKRTQGREQRAVEIVMSMHPIYMYMCVQYSMQKTLVRL